VPFPILIGTTLTTVLHYRADCDSQTYWFSRRNWSRSKRTTDGQ